MLTVHTYQNCSKCCHVCDDDPIPAAPYAMPGVCLYLSAPEFICGVDGARKMAARPDWPQTLLCIAGPLLVRSSSLHPVRVVHILCGIMSLSMMTRLLDL